MSVQMPASIKQKLQKLDDEHRSLLQQGQVKFHTDTPYDGPLPEEMLMLKYRQLGMVHSNEITIDISPEFWKYLYCAKITKFNLGDIVSILAACQRLTFFNWLQSISYSPDKISEATDHWCVFRKWLETISNHVQPLIEVWMEDEIDRLLRIQHLKLNGQFAAMPKSKR